MSPPRSGARSARSLLTVGVLVVVLALVALGWQWMASRDVDTTQGSITPPTPTVSQSPSPRATESQRPAPPVTVSRSPSAAVASRSATTPAEPGCMATARQIEPVRFTIKDIGVDAPMLSLGTDDSGAPESPPKEASHSVGWWNRGPWVGSPRGNVILTIHTYRQGGALGNQLNSKDGLKPGMVVRMTDGAGQTMCYRFERSHKLWVKDYDPNGKLPFDSTGRPQAVIVICWDFNRGTEEWDSRILYFLTPAA